MEEYGLKPNLSNLSDVNNQSLNSELPMMNNVPFSENLNPFKEIYSGGSEKYPDISLKEIKEATKQEERGSSIASKQDVFRMNSNPSIKSPNLKNDTDMKLKSPISKPTDEKLKEEEECEDVLQIKFDKSSSNLIDEVEDQEPADTETEEENEKLEQSE